MSFLKSSMSLNNTNSNWFNSCVQVSQQKDEDRRAALAQLASLKDAEVEAAKQGWEAKVTELLQQVTLLFFLLLKNFIYVHHVR